MWGPFTYKQADDIACVGSIAELTHRFVHGEIEDPQRYKELLAIAVARIVTSVSNKSGMSNSKKKRFCQQWVNRRIYSKSPLDMFISIEAFMLLAQHKTPEAAFRYSLQRTFAGIFALYTTAGQYVDVSDDAMHKYGSADMLSNIAARCAHFPLKLYTKTVTPSGGFMFTVTPRGACGTVVVREKNARLVDSVLFDFIRLLWNKASVIPRSDLDSVRAFKDGMQARYGPAGMEAVNACFDRVEMADGSVVLTENPSR